MGHSQLAAALREGIITFTLSSVFPNLSVVFHIGQTQPEARGQERTRVPHKSASQGKEQGVEVNRVDVPEKANERYPAWMISWPLLALLFNRVTKASGPALVMKPRSRRSHCHCTLCWPHPFQGPTSPEIILLPRVRDQGRDGWHHLYFVYPLNTLDVPLFYELTLFNCSLVG